MGEGAIIGGGAIMGEGAIIGGGAIMGEGAIIGEGAIMGEGDGSMMTISAGERLVESITLGLARVARPTPTRESSSSRGEPVNLSSLM
jgi:NDP-sugar pyrophosphorylase family protein